ncbi:MAG TPA: ferritin-like domain-containing protein [Acidobacteriaceae bacterium]
MANRLTEELISASPNRRSFLKTLGAATAAVGTLSVAAGKPANAQTGTEVEVLQFALNLEYLESEFYTQALYGQSIQSFGIKINGLANPYNPTGGGYTTGGKQVTFTNDALFSQEIAAQIGTDERAHVKLLRSALGSQAIAKPNLNLDALGFGFGTQDEFLQLARIFEDIGVSAYAGAAGLLSTPGVITTAARILAAEAEHVSSIRTQIAYFGISTSPLDEADLIPPPSGTRDHYLSVNPANGLVATRTPGEVLYLAFGGKAQAKKGGFFPSGVNGPITMSTEHAYPSNLD